MESFFSLLLFDSEFRYFPATYQAQFLKEQCNLSVSDQTLRNWKKKLIDLNWIAASDNDCRYYACRRGQKPPLLIRSGTKVRGGNFTAAQQKAKAPKWCEGKFTTEMAACRESNGDLRKME